MADDPGYAPPPSRPSFVFPPPRRSSSMTPTEAGQYIGEQMHQMGVTANDALDRVHNLGVVVDTYGDELAQKVGPDAVPTISPLSQTINRRADPVFGLGDFMIPPIGGEDAAVGLQAGGNTKGRIYLTFITPALNRAYERLNFFVSAVTDPCRMDVAVYMIDPATKQFSRQVHVTDVSLALGESVASVELPRWVAQQGSYLCIAWLQHGAGNARYLLGLNDTPRPLTNAIFPRKISAIFTGTGRTSLPATISGETQVDFAFWFTPYAELSENVGVDYKVFTEPWPNVGSNIGRPWVALTPIGIGSGGGYTSAYGVGVRVSMYDTPLATDHVRVRSSIYRDSSGGTARRSTLIVRGTNDLRSGLGLSAISRTRYELIRWSGLAVDSDEEWGDRTVLATIDLAPQQGQSIEVDFLDGVVDVRIDGVQRVSGLQVSGLSGPAYRFLGIQNRRQAFVTASWSPWFGPWSARDLPQDAGGDEEGDED